MKMRVLFFGEIKKSIVSACETIKKELPKIIPIKHTFSVFVGDTPSVDVFGAWGIFVPDVMDKKQKRLFPIPIAGAVPKNDLRKEDLPKWVKKKDVSAMCVALTIIHEMIHYDQFCKTGSIHERGVRPRAAKLLGEIFNKDKVEI